MKQFLDHWKSSGNAKVSENHQKKIKIAPESAKLLSTGKKIAKPLKFQLKYLNALDIHENHEESAENDKQLRTIRKQHKEPEICRINLEIAGNQQNHLTPPEHHKTHQKISKSLRIIGQY